MYALLGGLDTTSGSAHTHRGHIHVHHRSALSDLLSSRHWRVDIANQMGPAAGRGSLWVPNIHAAGAQLFGQLEHCGWVAAKKLCQCRAHTQRNIHIYICMCACVCGSSPLALYACIFQPLLLLLLGAYTLYFDTLKKHDAMGLVLAFLLFAYSCNLQKCKLCTLDNFASKITKTEITTTATTTKRATTAAAASSGSSINSCEYKITGHHSHAPENPWRWRGKEKRGHSILFGSWKICAQLTSQWKCCSRVNVATYIRYEGRKAERGREKFEA